MSAGQGQNSIGRLRSCPLQRTHCLSSGLNILLCLIPSGKFWDQESKGPLEFIVISRFSLLLCDSAKIRVCSWHWGKKPSALMLFEICTDQIRWRVALLEGTLSQPLWEVPGTAAAHLQRWRLTQKAQACSFFLHRANRVLPILIETLLKRNPNPWMTWISSQGKRNCKPKPKWPSPWPNQWPKCK